MHEQLRTLVCKPSKNDIKWVHNLRLDRNQIEEVYQQYNIRNNIFGGSMCMWRLVLLYFTITGKKIIQVQN